MRPVPKRLGYAARTAAATRTAPLRSTPPTMFSGTRSRSSYVACSRTRAAMLSIIVPPCCDACLLASLRPLALAVTVASRRREDRHPDHRRHGGDDGRAESRDGARWPSRTARSSAVGPSSEIDGKYAAKTVIRAGGHAVVPGFVNAHTHVPMMLFRGIADDRELMDWLHELHLPGRGEERRPRVREVGDAARGRGDDPLRHDDVHRHVLLRVATSRARRRRAGLRGVLGETMIDFPGAGQQDVGRRRWRTCASTSSEWKGDRLHHARARAARAVHGLERASAAGAAHWPPSSARRSSSTSPRQRTSCSRWPRSRTA